MTDETFIAHVTEHAGVSPDRAAVATRIVLSSLGAYVAGGRRDVIAEELPVALGDAFLASADRSVPVEERLLAPGESPLHARELIASVCRVLVETLSNEALDWLWLGAPSPFARYLER